MLFLEYMHHLGFKPDELGACYGLTMLATKIYLIPEKNGTLFISAFTQYCNYLQYKINSGMSAEAFAQEVSQWEKIISDDKLSLLEGKSVPPRHPYSLLASMRAFFARVMIFQNNQRTLPKLSESLPVFGDNPALTAAVDNDDIIEIDSFSGAYTNKGDGLLIYYKELSELLENKNTLLALKLSSMEHVVMIAYNPYPHQWILVNHHQIEYFKDASLLLQALAEIPSIFSKDGYAILNTTLYANKIEQQAAIDIVASWKKSETWKTLHSVTDDTASYENEKGVTWLHMAIDFNHASTVEELLSLKSVDRNKATAKGYTPIQYALRRNNEQLAAMLLKEPLADVNAVSSNGQSALYFAIRELSPTLVNMLLPHLGAGVSKQEINLLTLEVTSTHTEIFNILLNAGYISPNYFHESGMPLLHFLVFQKQKDMVISLLEHPDTDTSEIFESNGCRFTASEIAHQLGHKDIALILDQHNERLAQFAPRF